MDGTWNTRNDATNVWRMYSLCAGTGADGKAQIAYYNVGLGTEKGEKWRGGVFGYGFDAALIDVYEWLIENYNPGDEIFLFGFSRGAYTARSLAGLDFQMWVAPSSRSAFGQASLSAVSSRTFAPDDP